MTNPPSPTTMKVADAALRGDASALAAQLGSPDAFDLAAINGFGKACSLASLRASLSSYLAEVLEPHEWPVIREAYQLAASGKARELIALDRAWSQRVRRKSKSAAKASLRVGQRQLNRLRPLRDNRVVQRYLEAVAAQEAAGWHPIVYGVMLAAFGLPLRQGLVHYAAQTLRGLAGPAPTGALLTDTQKQAALAEAETALPVILARVMALGEGAALRVI